MRFTLDDTLPGPVSVAEHDGEVVIVLRAGTVVDEVLVRMLDDLVRPDNGEP